MTRGPCYKAPRKEVPQKKKGLNQIATQLYEPDTSRVQSHPQAQWRISTEYAPQNSTKPKMGDAKKFDLGSNPVSISQNLHKVASEAAAQATGPDGSISSVSVVYAPRLQVSIDRCRPTDPLRMQPWSYIGRARTSEVNIRQKTSIKSKRNYRQQRIGQRSNWDTARIFYMASGEESMRYQRNYTKRKEKKRRLWMQVADQLSQYMPRLLQTEVNRCTCGSKSDLLHTFPKHAQEYESKYSRSQVHTRYP